MPLAPIKIANAAAWTSRTNYANNTQGAINAMMGVADRALDRNQRDQHFQQKQNTGLMRMAQDDAQRRALFTLQRRKAEHSIKMEEQKIPAYLKVQALKAQREQMVLGETGRNIDNAISDDQFVAGQPSVWDFESQGDLDTYAAETYPQLKTPDARKRFSDDVRARRKDFTDVSTHSDLMAINGLLTPEDRDDADRVYETVYEATGDGIQANRSATQAAAEIYFNRSKKEMSPEHVQSYYDADGNLDRGRVFNEVRGYAQERVKEMTRESRYSTDEVSATTVYREAKRELRELQKTMSDRTVRMTMDAETAKSNNDRIKELRGLIDTLPVRGLRESSATPRTHVDGNKAPLPTEPDRTAAEMATADRLFGN